MQDNYGGAARLRVSGRARKELIARAKPQLNAIARSALARVMPDGFVAGREFCCGDVHGTPGESWKYNLHTHRWKDWSSAERGGVGVFDVYVAHFGGDVDAALELALSILAMDPTDMPMVRNDRASDRSTKPKGPWHEVEPPADAPPPAFKSLWRGAFKQAWEYRDLTGRRVQYVARYQNGTKKDTPAVTWGHVGDGACHWRARGGKFILYGLETLAGREACEVWVFEGEKTAERARILFPHVVCLAWKGGAGSVNKIDFSPLAGMRGRFIADRDLAGHKAMESAAERALAAGALAVSVVTFPDEFPEGWDVADDVPPGWTLTRILAYIEASPWRGQPTPPPPRGTKEGVEPYWRTDPRPVAEVRATVENLIREKRGESLALRITPGSGKTWAEIKASVAAGEWNIFAEPNHGIALEVLADMEAERPGFGRHMAGRGYAENGKTLCEYPEDAEAAHAAGLNTTKDLCAFCPVRFDCRWFEKVERIGDAMRSQDAGSVVTVHPYLSQVLNNEIDTDKLARLIIDERIDMDKKTRIPADRMHECSRSVLGEEIVAAFDRSGFLDLTRFDVEELEDRAKAETHELSIKLADGLTFDQRREAIRAHARQRKMDYRWRFHSLFRTMAEEIRAGRKVSNQITLVRNIKVGKAEPRDYVMIHGRKEIAAKLNRLPVHYVDGTMDQAHAKALLGDDVEFHRIDAARNLFVSQVSDSLFSKNRLLHREESPRYRREVYRFIRALAAKHSKILIGVPKAIRDVMEAEWTAYAADMAEPPIVSFIHHNKGRGENAYKTYDCCVLIGREEPGVRDIEAMARCRFPNQTITPIPSTDEDGENGPAWPRRLQGYTMRDGRKLGVEVSYHPCPLCQSVLEQVREGEMVQITDRLRGVGREETGHLYILCQVPTEIPVDRLVSWRDLLREVAGAEDGRGHWWQEALKIGGGVAPLTGSWLVENGIFGTVSAARKAVTRLAKQIGQYVNITNIDVVSNLPEMATFRTAGHRGKDSLVLIAHDTDDAPALLARHVGPLARYDGEEVENRDPAAYEPDELADSTTPAAPGWIRLDTEDGMAAFKRALTAAGTASARRQERLAAWLADHEEDCGSDFDVAQQYMHLRPDKMNYRAMHNRSRPT